MLHLLPSRSNIRAASRNLPLRRAVLTERAAGHCGSTFSVNAGSFAVQYPKYRAVGKKNVQIWGHLPFVVGALCAGTIGANADQAISGPLVLEESVRDGACAFASGYEDGDHMMCFSIGNTRTVARRIGNERNLLPRGEGYGVSDPMADDLPVGDIGVDIRRIVAIEQSLSPFFGNTSAAGGGNANFAFFETSNTANRQVANEETFVSSIFRSSGSVIVATQSGQANFASASIENSPGSAILIAQLGAELTAVAAIRGGEGNGIAIAQLGTGHTAGVSLVDSVGTTVLFAQTAIKVTDANHTLASSPNGQTGAYTIRNAPRGTVIRVGLFEDDR